MTPRPPFDPFETLLGTWHLTRDIPGQATAHGQATVRLLTPDEARYDEQVTVQLLSGPGLQGSAAYLFRRQPPGLTILFAHTGRLFHQLHFVPTPDPGTSIHAQPSLIAQSTHHCAADQYHSTYRIHSPTHITIEHRVHGPRKHYTSHTTLTRA